jgi:hypothetical protein
VLHRVVARVPASLAVQMTAEIQPGHGRQGAQGRGQAGRHPAAAAGRGPARAGEVIALPGQRASRAGRQVRSGGRGEVRGREPTARREHAARDGVTQGQGVPQHVRAVGHHPGAGRPFGGSLGQHVVDKIGDGRRHVGRQCGHRLVLVGVGDGQWLAGRERNVPGQAFVGHHTE